MDTDLQSAATSQLVGEPAIDQPRSQRVWVGQLVPRAMLPTHQGFGGYLGVVGIWYVHGRLAGCESRASHAFLIRAQVAEGIIAASQLSFADYLERPGR